MMLLRSLQLNISTNGDNIVIAAVAGSPIHIYKILFSTAAAVNISFKDGASTVLGGPYIFTAAGSSMTLYYDSTPHWVVSNSNDFIMNLSSGVAVTGQVQYTYG